jgi:arylsulfatase A-like enzyme
LILRVPGPAGERRRRVTRFTESVDLFPTLIDWLGGSVPNQADGHSLMPFVEGEVVDNWRNAAHWTYDFREVASRTAESHFRLPSTQCTCSVLRGERYKYVHFPSLPPVLFDLEADPHEQHNLVDDPAHREIRLACAEELLAWLTTHRDESLSLIALGPQISYGTRNE